MRFNTHLSQYPMWTIIRQCNYSWTATLPELPKGLSPAGYQHNIIKVRLILKLTTFCVRIQDMAHCTKSDSLLMKLQSRRWYAALPFHLMFREMQWLFLFKQSCNAMPQMGIVCDMSSATSLAFHYLFSCSHPEHQHDNNLTWNLPKTRKRKKNKHVTRIHSEQWIYYKNFSFTLLRN